MHVCGHLVIETHYTEANLEQSLSIYVEWEVRNRVISEENFKHQPTFDFKG